MGAPTLTDRASGVLLHPTSLPGPYGNGDLGQEARRFLGFLTAARQRWWQMLPVGPAGYGNSPYSAQSAFAGNPLLIDLDDLAARGLLSAHALAPEHALPQGRVDYARAIAFRDRHLRTAFVAFERAGGDGELAAFEAKNRAWLEDFALYRAIKRAHGEVEWTRWPEDLRRRDPAALARVRRELGREIAYERFLQLVFDRQWQAFRAAAAARGVGLIGDLPIFVAHDSADVWAHPHLFRLDDHGQPTHVAGVPPDYFSATGQRWGNPLYRWHRMRDTGYAWWIARLRQTLERFDAVRLDHFIGFQRYWSIPATCPTAVDGKWIRGPGLHFFEAVRRELGGLPLIAEDLGAITPAVKRLRDRLRLPGIRILQFAFGTDPSASDFLPHHFPRRAVVYTGTHDNDTVVGWFHDRGGGDGTRSPEQTAKERRAVLRYLGKSDDRDLHWAMIRCASASVARLAMFPLQDLLGLGEEARMNHPGRANDNWEWRFEEGALAPAVAERLAEITMTYGRSPEALRE